MAAQLSLRISRWIGGILLLPALVAVFLLSATPASAAPYGSGTFGDCTYEGCTETPPTTIITTSKFQISVNLTNNQVIPSTGYTVIVRLLSSPSVPLKYAEFSIDGQLIKHVDPLSATLVRWFWDTKQFTGSTIKVVAVDKANHQAERDFSFTISDVPLTTASTNPIDIVHESLVNAVGDLPEQVVYAFPYILFLLIGANGVVLLLHARREVREYRVLQRLAAGSKATSDAKRTFVQLVSHYLRTPITLIKGGVDMLSELDSRRPQVTALAAVADRMLLKIEALVAQVEEVRENEPKADLPRKVTIWKQPALFVPVLSIAVLAAGFDLLASEARSLSTSQVNLFAQLIAFVLVVVLLYVALRSRQLKRRDKVEMKAILDQQAESVAARDALITSAVAQLKTELDQLDVGVEELGSTDAKLTNIIRNGQARFHNILGKFAIASQLRGGLSSEPFNQTSLQNLFTAAMKPIQANADAKHVVVGLSGDAAVATRNLALTGYVLGTVLDNAIAYSPDGGEVTVSSTPDPTGLLINVSDRGKGIPQEQVSLLFQPFTKSEGADVFTHEGMGFSLYLDKLIMVYLGGDIAVTSRPGSGTTVSLKLPGTLVIQSQ